MTRTHIDALEERVRRLSANIGELNHEVATARTRVTALEAAVADPTSAQRTPTSEGPLGGSDSQGADHTGATPAEVAAAVRTVEDALDEDDSDACEDEIIIV